MSILRRVIERVVIVSAALILSGALWRLFSGGTDGGIDGDSRAQVVLAIVYVSVAIFAVIEVRRTAQSLYSNPALVALLLLACVSPVWSDSPDLVFRRALGLVGTTLFGVVLATRYSFDEQLRILRWSFRIAAAGTFAILLVAPNRALSAPGGGGGLRGVFPHKNIMGAAMALAFLVEWYLRDARPKAKTLRLLSLCVFAGLLVVSDSMTSIVTAITTLGAVWTVRVLYARYRVPLSAIAVFALIAATALIVTGVGPGDVLGLIGRSSDMTGRTELWSAVVDAIAQKPILGFGFSGFWKGASAASETIRGQVQWTPTYSHNGYLEIALSLGFVGLSLVIALLAKGFKRAWVQGRAGDSPQNSWPLALFMFVAIHNLTECSIAWQNCLEWSVCVATIVGCDPGLHAMLESPEEIEHPLPHSASEMVA